MGARSAHGRAGASPTETAILARSLTKHFGALTALDALDLDVRRGESLAVFGPNGAGKTTLLRILSLVSRPTAGTLAIDGLDPRRHGPEILARCGVVTHQPLVYDTLTVRENLRFFARLYGVDRADSRLARLLRVVRLEDRADDRAGTLSRGLLQRLALARCLVHEPRIVFLDEPFSGLDPRAGEALRRTLGELREDGRTVIVATHDLAAGLALSDRWILLDRGRTVGGGRSSDTDPRELRASYEGSGGRR